MCNLHYNPVESVYPLLRVIYVTSDLHCSQVSHCCILLYILVNFLGVRFVAG